MAKRDIAVDFGAFHRSGAAAQNFVRDVLNQADRNLEGLDAFHWYGAFLFLWASFNHWGARVTGAETDAEMISGLGRDRRLTQIFNDLVQEDRAFNSVIAAFSRQWPIFSVLHVRRAGLYEYMVENGRLDVRERLLAAGVKRGPSGDYLAGVPTWRQTLEAIYVVRCNLAHGDKGEAEDDPEIVRNSHRVLLHFIRAGQLYDLPDRFED